MWQAGERVAVYYTRTRTRALYTTPDRIQIDIEDFNRKVITQFWNETVCAYLAREIEPTSREKTLIFCVNDAHADLVVSLLKQAFQARYGAVDDDGVMKITGSADKPDDPDPALQNELNPTVAVTVDLLTTGIDVPDLQPGVSAPREQPHPV